MACRTGRARSSPRSAARPPNYRTQLREAQKSLEAVATPEEYGATAAELTTKLTELETELLRTKVAAKHELPDEMAARLRGTRVDELEADARTLAALVQPAPPTNFRRRPHPGRRRRRRDGPAQGRTTNPPIASVRQTWIYRLCPFHGYRTRILRDLLSFQFEIYRSLSEAEGC